MYILSLSPLSSTCKLSGKKILPEHHTKTNPAKKRQRQHGKLKRKVQGANKTSDPEPVIMEYLLCGYLHGASFPHASRLQEIQHKEHRNTNPTDKRCRPERKVKHEKKRPPETPNPNAVMQHRHAYRPIHGNSL
jgi:hypothetical protein